MVQRNKGIINVKKGNIKPYKPTTTPLLILVYESNDSVSFL